MLDLTAVPPEKNGVFWEDGTWCGYVRGRMVACGPDRPLIVAATRHHNEAEQDRLAGGDG